MKFIFIGDLHITDYKNDIKIGNISKKLYSINECLNEMIQYHRENLPKDSPIIFGGDIFDKRNYEYAAALEVFLDILESNKDISFIAITGNHDISDNTDDCYNLLRIFQKYENFKLIDYGKYELLENILLVSYSKDMIGTLRDAYESYGDKAQILVSHFGVNEAQLSSGLSRIDPIRFSDLAPYFKLILLGHYHKPQEIKIGDSTLYYSGSLIQKDWGERGEEKRFLVVDTETLEVELIPFTKYPKHILLEATIENIENMKEKYKQLVNEGHYVNIIFESHVNDQDQSDEKQIKKIKLEEQKLINKLIEEENVKVTIVEDKNIVNEVIDFRGNKLDTLKQLLDIVGIKDEDKEKYIGEINNLATEIFG
jgi:DNA repair exonuclease SbcCD nuclease subunit